MTVRCALASAPAACPAVFPLVAGRSDPDSPFEGYPEEVLEELEEEGTDPLSSEDLPGFRPLTFEPPTVTAADAGGSATGHSSM